MPTTSVCHRRWSLSPSYIYIYFRYATAELTELEVPDTSNMNVHVLLRTRNAYSDSPAVVATVWTTGPGFAGLTGASITLYVK